MCLRPGEKTWPITLFRLIMDFQKFYDLQYLKFLCANFMPKLYILKFLKFLSTIIVRPSATGWSTLKELGTACKPLGTRDGSSKPTRQILPATSRGTQGRIAGNLWICLL